MDLGGVGWEGAAWIHLAQGRSQWRTRVNTVMNLRFHKIPGIFWLAEWLSFSRRAVPHGCSSKPSTVLWTQGVPSQMPMVSPRHHLHCIHMIRSTTMRCLAGSEPLLRKPRGMGRFRWQERPARQVQFVPTHYGEVITRTMMFNCSILQTHQMH
jgi:hypothetical protein